MRPSVIFAQHRETIRRLVLEHGMSNPRLFGSALHGDDTDASDLDILVDVPSGTGGFRILECQMALEDLVRMRVDLRTPGELHRGYREEVLHEALPL